MIAPTFHINILKSFIGVFNQNSKTVVEKLRSETGKTFDVHDYMSTATVDILLGKVQRSILNVINVKVTLSVCYLFIAKTSASAAGTERNEIKRPSQGAS